MMDKFFLNQLGKEMQNVLFIRFTDADYYHRMKPLEHYTIDPAGGRTKNTRDSWDIESVIQIPIGEFRLLQDRNCGADGRNVAETSQVESIIKGDS